MDWYQGPDFGRFRGARAWNPPPPIFVRVDMDWHPQTPPNPRVLTPNTPEYYASQIPGAFPEDNVVISEPVVSGRKRKRDEYEEDEEESLNPNRHKRVCYGIYTFIGGFFAGLYTGQEATQGERQPVARRLGESIHHGTAAASHTASTFIINSSYQIVRIVREIRRNARRAHRARNPLPELRQSPFRRAIVAKEGLLARQATTPAHARTPASDAFNEEAAEANASTSTPEVVDSEFITVKAGPTCRKLLGDFESAKKERHIRIRSGAADPFQNMPRFTPPREPSPKRVKTPVQKKMTDLPPCNPLEDLFPRIDARGVQPPQLPTPPDSPTTQLITTQLMQELSNSIGDESDSDVSSTVEPSWIRPSTKRTVRFKTRSYVQTPQSEISSTCDASPGPTPHLEIPTVDRSQIDGPSHPHQKEPAVISIIDATPTPTPKLETSKFETPKVETPKVETPTVETPTVKTPTVKTPTVETPKVETPKVETPKVETPKVETPKVETPIARPASAKGKAPQTPDSEISSTCDATPGPTPQLPTPNQLEHRLASQLNITPIQPSTPKSTRHSSEKLGRTTRAQKRAQDLLDDSKKYTLAPLSAEQQQQVQEAVRNGHGKLSATDMRRVVPLQGASGTSAWLNDEAVNAYLELVAAFGKRNDRKEQAIPSHHAFSSYFYTNLSTRGPESIKRWVKKAGIDGKKLLETKYVFIPINHGMHWTLAVVSGQQKTITHYNSLPGGGGRHLRLVEDWVKGELGSAWVGEEWSVVNGESPQQQNSDDCGVFTVTNARQLMLGLGGQFAAAQIPLQRQRMVAELVAGELVKGEE